MDNLQPGWSTSDVVRGVGYNIMTGKSAIKSGQYPMGSVVSNEVRNTNKSGMAKSEGIKRTDAFDIESQNEDRASDRRTFV
jgi:hypothetical protein